jgi:hypothetical protein
MKKIAIAFVMLALAIALFSAKAVYADTASGNVTITNAVPTMGTATLLNQAGADAAITLTAGSTVIVTASVTVTDTNGGANIANATGKLYHSTSTSAGADDENIHLTNSTCTLGTPSGNDVLATCKFTMNFMALGGTWTANITATDLANTVVSAQDNNTVNDLAGLDVTDTVIEFGGMALGTNTTSPTTMTVRSQGNVQIDAQYKGDAYACTAGTIPVGNTAYGLTGANYDELSALTNLTVGDVTQTGFDLGVRGVATANGANSDKNELWGILIPTSGISGTCTDTLTVTAIAG